MTRYARNRRGFTIIELIVAIAIIATLSTIVTSSVVIFIGRAKDTSVKANLIQIAKELHIYFSDNNTFEGFSPSSLTMPCSESYQINSDSLSFAVFAKLCTTDDYWCVDSKGGVFSLVNPPDPEVCECIAGQGACVANSACEDGENCNNCPQDCGCSGCDICSNGVCTSTCNPENCEQCVFSHDYAGWVCEGCSADQNCEYCDTAERVCKSFCQDCELCTGTAGCANNCYPGTCIDNQCVQ